MIKTRTTVVYCAINLLNGKKYIGVTYDLAQRRQEHFINARSKRRRPTAFSRAIIKYGEMAFQFSVLSTWETREQALAEEIRLIAVQKPEYNMTGGGDGLTLVRNRPVIRLRDGRHYESGRSAAKDNGVSPLRITQICQGGGMTKTGELFMYADQSGPPKSIRKTPEQLLEVKAKILIAAAKGRATQSKPVVCSDDGRMFPSISAAARHYGQHLTSVADAIHRNGRAGGLKFQLHGAA